MKRVLLFTLPIILITAVAFVIFGIYQVRTVSDRMTYEVKSKAKAVAESMEISAAQVLADRNIKTAGRLVDKFERHERLQGCAIYDSRGELFVISKRFADWKHKDKSGLMKAVEEKVPRGELTTFKDLSVYTYVYPVLNEDGQVLGLIEIIYDTSYIATRISDLWNRISITLIVMSFAVIVISMLAHRQLFVIPVRRLTEWFNHLQKGTQSASVSIRETGDLGRLAVEVEQIALSLKVARRSLIEEAQTRVEQGDLWTEQRLRDLVVARLGENALFVVSNREPYIHYTAEGSRDVKLLRPASGVVTALDPVLRACGGTWIAHGSGNADRRFVNRRDKLGVPPGDERYILKRVWITKEEEEGYYFGFSNEGLWPLCHITHTRPIFRESDWNMYERVNRKFADALLEELPADSPLIFIQDYHFTLLPAMIKEERPDAIIALFWHIPWPNPEIFSICPYRERILEGMLSCDLIGFHVQFHCNNFLATADRLLECRIDTEKFSVNRGGQETFVRSFPISVDEKVFGTWTEEDLERIEELRSELKLEDKIVAVSVERLDYTKGIIERILAIDRFLEKYPEYQKRFVFIQIAAPSRTHIKRYHDLMNEIDELIGRKNWKYADGEWEPIIYFKRQFSHEQIKPYFGLADLCIVSSLHDGMNLVAKEFIAAKNDFSGMLILSQFTGAARELTGAIQINPYAVEEFADAVKAAVEMPEREKRGRMAAMRDAICRNNVYAWAAGIVSNLSELKNI